MVCYGMITTVVQQFNNTLYQGLAGTEKCLSVKIVPDGDYPPTTSQMVPFNVVTRDAYKVRSYTGGSYIDDSYDVVIFYSWEN